jgi:hypothetical protein
VRREKEREEDEANRRERRAARAAAKATRSPKSPEGRKSVEKRMYCCSHHDLVLTSSLRCTP